MELPDSINQDQTNYSQPNTSRPRRRRKPQLYRRLGNADQYELPSDLDEGQVIRLHKQLQDIEKKVMAIDELVHTTKGLSYKCKSILIQFIKYGQFILQHEFRLQEVKL
jgi:hypothetical protein